MRCGLRRTLPLLALAGCNTFAFDGYWLGVCDTPDLDFRVLAQVYSPGEEGDLHAQVQLHRPDQRGTSVSVDCAEVEEEVRDVRVARCIVTSEATGAPYDLELTGTMGRGDHLVNVLVGECTIDGHTGDLDLWRIP